MGKILAVIPARSGSKRIPGKNVKELNGMPLIEYTILSAIMCNLIDKVVISTDIPSLDSYSREYKSLSIRDRPEHLLGDEIQDLAVIRDVLDGYGSDWELVVYLRPTTPFRADYHITEAIKQIRAASINATGLRSVELMSESAFKCFTMPAFLSPIPCNGKDMTDIPNQLVTPTYKPNGYIDICKPEIVARGKLWGDWVIGYITPRTVEIDTPEDWDYAEFMARQHAVKQNIEFGVREV
jgi:CMP-N,N'-diacetyllegionaminic acid synthase